MYFVQDALDESLQTPLCYIMKRDQFVIQARKG